MEQILEAITGGASGEDLAALPVPQSYRAAHLLRSEQEMFAGMESSQKDPRQAIHVGEVPTPELAPDEVYVAVMASAINFNTVWSATYEPVSTFGALDRLARQSEWSARHAQDFHVIGSDASGVVVQVGSAVRAWKPGDRVVVHCNYVDDQDPLSHDDAMLASNEMIWGYETNFGGLADLAVVRANQLMPKPAHLSWEEAACNALVNSTSYRMLLSPNSYQIKQGEAVLIWGASGGLGGYAVQYCLNGGATPVAVVSSDEKADVLREMGVEHVINRKTQGYQFWKDEHTQDPKEWRRLGTDIRDLIGRDVDVVFEHPGRQTFGASVYVVGRGGAVVTCAATSGYMLEFDNRHLWMRLKRIIGSHFANYHEAWQANQLICDGKIQPILSAVHDLAHTGEAAYQMHQNLHEGKIGVLCLASEEGQGIDDPELREQVGEDKITLFRRAGG
ncbi:MAG: crotonyl-CoA carboxylase/reductase [Acidimicrobiales bacterium]|nr:crotonyl-CoA carboxylase/reductase [Acidimicrobiales bacterium]